MEVWRSVSIWTSILEFCVYREADSAEPILTSSRGKSPCSARVKLACPRRGVYRGSDGELMLSDGVTRATRIAKLCPGATIRVEVVRTLEALLGRFPTMGDTLP